MVNKVGVLFGIAAGLSWILGCMGEKVAGGTGVGNPPQGLAVFSMQAVSAPAGTAKASAGRTAMADTSFTVTDSAGTRFTIRSSQARVALVQLKLPEGVKCSKALELECLADEVKLKNPFVADLMTGRLMPDLGTFRLPIGAYKVMKVRLDPLKEIGPGVDSALLGHSVIIAGNFDYAGKPDRAFVIALDISEDVSYQSDSGLTIQESVLNHLTLYLNAKGWLGKANITRCLDQGTLKLDSAGNLRIDKAKTCEGLEQALKDGVKSSGFIGKGK